MVGRRKGRRIVLEGEKRASSMYLHTLGTKRQYRFPLRAYLAHLMVLVSCPVMRDYCKVRERSASTFSSRMDLEWTSAGDGMSRDRYMEIYDKAHASLRKLLGSYRDLSRDQMYR